MAKTAEITCINRDSRSNLYERITFVGTSSLIRAFVESGGRRVVSLGTCAEYEWGEEVLVEKVSAERPASFYGSMKLLQNQMLMSAATHFRFSAAVARVFFVYGPGENPSKVVPFACQRLLSGKDVTLNRPNALRDYLYVSDVAEGLLSLVLGEIEGSCNVCSGETVRLSDLLGMLARIAGRPNAIKSEPVHDPLPDRLVGDNSLLRSTGWRPNVPNESGLSQTLHWWRQRSF